MQDDFHKENIGLLDIIDMDFLQNFQDAFAKAVNIACIMVDNVGPITNPSNFTDFCINYTRESKLGCERCNKCDIEGGERASKEGKPVIYACHSGLTDFAVPIIVNEKHIASILGGQILTQKPEEQHFREIARELGIDEDKYIEELNKIKIIPPEQVQAAAELAFVVANAISNMANKNLELKQKNSNEMQIAEKELLLRKISERIRSSLDINETLSYICDELAKIFNVQRATIIKYHDNEKFSDFEVRREYKSDPSIKGILNNPDFNLKVGEIWAKALNNDEGIITIDNIQNSDMPDFFKENYANIGQKSIIIAPIKKDTIKWGVIILSEYNYYRHWTEYDIQLLEIISNQIYMAINQSELYLSLQKKANSENVLRNIISSSVNNFNTKDIIKSLIFETCNLFSADRCLFIEYDNQNGTDTCLKSYYEHISSPEITPVSSDKLEKLVIDSLTKIIEEKEIFFSANIDEDNLMDETKSILKKQAVKSFLIVPVHYGPFNYGAIVLHYVKTHKQFNNEEIELIKVIANQSSAIIHQAKLISTINKNEKYTRTVLDNIQDGIITIDDDFVIETCNPAIKTIWGYEPEECIGKPLAQLLKYNIDTSKNDLSFEPASIKGINKEGHIFPVEIDVSKVLVDDKKFNLLAIRDITERQKVEQMKNEFVSTVSHELRTPLTSIRGALGLVQSGKMGALSDKITSLLDIANNNCLRLINLINDILDIEKIEAGKMDFEIKTEELVTLVKNAIQSNIQYAQKLGVQLTLINELEEVFVDVDSNRLIQVLTNLISNASKFSEQNSSVEIAITRLENKNTVRISVTNYGSEISDDFKTKIFNKFAQADSSDSRQKGGTGLGLSISKAIIEKMNGRIGFFSENKKTTFYFDLLENTKNNEGKTE